MGQGEGTWGPPRHQCRLEGQQLSPQADLCLAAKQAKAFKSSKFS